jgi:hypothetical protein
MRYWSRWASSRRRLELLGSDRPSNSALLSDAFGLLRCAYGAAKRER